MVTPWDVRPQTQKLEIYILNKQYQGKVLLTIFYLNGNTIGFDPETQKYIYIYKLYIRKFVQQALSTADCLYGQNKSFSCGTKQGIPSGYQIDRICFILPTFGANHDIGYFSVLLRKGRKDTNNEVHCTKIADACVFEMTVIKNGQA